MTLATNVGGIRRLPVPMAGTASERCFLHVPDEENFGAISSSPTIHKTGFSVNYHSQARIAREEST
jgi:hypothetical protein